MTKFATRSFMKNHGRTLFKMTNEWKWKNKMMNNAIVISAFLCYANISDFERFFFFFKIGQKRYTVPLSRWPPVYA